MAALQSIIKLLSWGAVSMFFMGLSRAFVPKEMFHFFWFASYFLAVLPTSIFYSWVDTFPRYFLMCLQWSYQRFEKSVKRLIYYQGFIIFFLVIISYWCWFYYLIFAMIIGIIFNGIVLKHEIQEWKAHFQTYKRQNQFPFENLPFHIKKRFFELQSPIGKFNMVNAKAKWHYFDRPYTRIKSGIITVNNLELGVAIFLDPFDFSNHYELISWKQNVLKPVLTLSICVMEYFLKESFQVRILDRASFREMKASDFKLYISLKQFDFNFLKYLKVEDSIMNSEDLDCLKLLKVKYINLKLRKDETPFMEKIDQILNCVIGASKIQVWYGKHIGNEIDIPVLLTNWVIENGYVEEIYLRGFESAVFTSTTIEPDNYWPF